MKLSIIVPVYNTEAYLNKCIQSLLAQKISDYEIILVDDGSSDNSAEICKRYEKEFPNIRYIYQDNQGPSLARNTGIANSKGEYIGFCDSDDIVDSEMYLLLLEGMEKRGCQMAICDFYSERDSKVGGIPWEDSTVLERKAILEEYIPSMVGNKNDFSENNPLWGSVVRAVFLRSMIEEQNVFFQRGIHFAEDLLFTLQYLKNVDKVSVVNRPLYRYTYNPRSIMNTHTSYKVDMFETRLQVLEHVREVLCELGIMEANEARMQVAARAYFHEAIGNACRECSKRGVRSVWQEVRTISQHPIVRKAFATYQGGFQKQGLVYLLIKYRITLLLLLYYVLRFKGQ